MFSAGGGRRRERSAAVLCGIQAVLASPPPSPGCGTPLPKQGERASERRDERAEWGMKMADAKQKRNEQLKRWIGSETDLEPPVVKRKKTKVKFDDGAVFLAACSSGDTEEVLRLLERGADINYANVDGLTALHQVRVSACLTDRPGQGLPWLGLSWQEAFAAEEEEEDGASFSSSSSINASGQRWLREALNRATQPEPGLWQF